MFRLITCGTGSKGNNYALVSENEILLIEAGVRLAEVKRAIGFQTSKIAGCLISHEHGDHASRIEEYQRNAIKCYSTDEVHTGIETIYGEKTEVLQPNRANRIGGFTVQPFDLVHDVPCNGFLIKHKDFGKLIYASDTEYIPQDFSKLHCNHLLIECNHIIENISENYIKSLRDRIISTHLSLTSCKTAVANINNDELYNVVLIHLSESNSDRTVMQKEVQALTYANTFVAEPGLEVELKNNPF